MKVCVDGRIYEVRKDRAGRKVIYVSRYMSVLERQALRSAWKSYSALWPVNATQG